MERRCDWRARRMPEGQQHPTSRSRNAASPIRHGVVALDRTSVVALQRSAGNAAVQRLVKLTEPPKPERTLTRTERRAFVNAELKTRRGRVDGMEVMRDMAAAGDVMRFGSREELRTELVKRVVMTQVMQSSQVTSKGLAAFGYPFTKPSLYWGPRVGFAAKDFWEPPPPDGYSLRDDPAKRAEIRSKPRGQRHTVYGDQSDYTFKLTASGIADPHAAILTLFERQAPHKRTLIHCDYLISLVHFRALMATMGKAAFNAKITAYGPDKITLRWDLFREVQDELPGAVAGTTRPGLGSIQRVRPSSTADLVVGDHVFFHNHKAYDVINERIGNAWRLENAVLIIRRSGTDIFVGHGSGEKTDAQMRAKLAEEYNDVANMALLLVQKTKSRSAATRTSARADLASKFPNVKEVGGKWRIVGTGIFSLPVDIPLSTLRASQIPGLFDPADPTRMFQVRRPIESA